jgi:hypothetical protein
MNTYSILGVGVVYSQNTGDGSANVADLGKLGSSTSSNLGYTELRQLKLEPIKSLKEIILGFSAKLKCLDCRCRSTGEVSIKGGIW